MRCKIVRFQKFMWRNIMRSTKSQKISVLCYSIDLYDKSQTCEAEFFFFFFVKILNYDR
jgi:hypothetical protein